MLHSLSQDLLASPDKNSQARGTDSKCVLTMCAFIPSLCIHRSIKIHDSILEAFHFHRFYRYTFATCSLCSELCCEILHRDS